MSAPAFHVCPRGHVREKKQGRTHCLQCDAADQRGRRDSDRHYGVHIRLPRPPDWMAEAACAEADPELWFAPTEGGFRPAPEGRKAAAICMGCPVAAECLTYAMAAEGGISEAYRFGIYGGLTAAQRAKIARRKVR